LAGSRNRPVVWRLSAETVNLTGKRLETVMAFSGVSYLAILAAAVAGWLIGAAWYMTLAKPWMAAIGKTEADLKGPSGKPSPIPFIISFVAELVMAWTLAGIIGHAGPVTIVNGLISGFLVWLGFVATTMLVNHSFGGQKRTLTVIDGGHWLAVLLVQGLVIGAVGVR
jgi:Protein of unknown function (DUF1761)